MSYILNCDAQYVGRYDTILNDATQRSILIMIGEVMAQCSHRHHLVDRCGVGRVPLSREAKGVVSKRKRARHCIWLWRDTAYLCTGCIWK